MGGIPDNPDNLGGPGGDGLRLDSPRAITTTRDNRYVAGIGGAPSLSDGASVAILAGMRGNYEAPHRSFGASSPSFGGRELVLSFRDIEPGDRVWLTGSLSPMQRELPKQQGVLLIDEPLIVIPLIDLTAIVTKEIQKARYGTPVTMTH